MLNVAALLFLGLLSQDPLTPQDEKLRTLFDSLVKAMAEQDADGLKRCFHTARMVKEMEARGFGAASDKPEDQEKRIRTLQAALPKIAAGANATGTTWEKVRILAVQHQAGADEAVVSTRLTIGGGKSKVRFWLAKDGDWWKVYDFEMQEGSVRLSVMIGAIWTSMTADGANRRAVLQAFAAFQKAAVQMASGDVEEAKKVLEFSLRGNPPAILVGWLELLHSQVLAMLGENEEAVKAADRALQAQKDLHLALHLKAAALFELEKYEACIETELLYLKNSGEDAEGWLIVGNAYDKLKQSAKAIEAYRKGAADDDEDSANRLQLGRLLIEQKKPEEARVPLKEASKNASADEGVFEEAVELLDGARDVEGVQDLVAERLKRTPDDVSVLRWQGRALRRLRKFDEAEKVLKAALEKDKDDPDLADELIYTLAAAGKDTEAMERIGKLEDQEDGRAHLLRLFAHLSAGRTEKALLSLTVLLDEESWRKEELEKDQDFEKFLKEAPARKILELLSASQDFHRELSERMQKKDWDGLLKLARERAAAAPQDKWASYAQAIALKEQGKLFDAELAFKAAIARTKDKKEFRQELGKVLAAQGKLDEALPLADELAAVGDKMNGLYLRMAVYVVAKKPEPALKALADLLQEFPEAGRLLEDDEDLAVFRKLEAVQTLIRKVKARAKDE